MRSGEVREGWRLLVGAAMACQLHSTSRKSRIVLLIELFALCIVLYVWLTAN